MTELERQARELAGAAARDAEAPASRATTMARHVGDYFVTVKIERVKR